MVQAIFKWNRIMSMRYNDQYGSSDIHLISYNDCEISRQIWFNQYSRDILYWVWDIMTIMFQAIFNWYLIMSMRYNDEYGSSDIQGISYDEHEI